ncbi:hypothetical protein BXZ70DRAFT_931561 [Cristinia sonorae]|uniref:FHA domain-containing protein n=1 Tax=Cristinia sonorae TaxID=1940300 RepID=A0A8K0USK0_9AGAR|nr:hypothetical protein BXZ70DRAFT_931561 [Cristinia sonorae]
MDSSEIGRYGTLHLMKRLDPNAFAASYPIDEEEITIGRDTNCSIRLYYDTVSMLHCKIIFRERKAFVEVLGTNGLLVDGCPVFPANSPSANHVTVPLSNNSTIEIHKKCFRFCYPPKELRPMLIATPPRYQDPVNGKHRRRTLRMSMIQSAQVFSPGPSEDPRENLRILKTPLKTPFFAPSEPSPLKRGAIPDPEDEDAEEEDIVLVETNHPKVTEEDKDLVILEHVEIDENARAPGTPRQAQSRQMVQYPIAQPVQPSPQVPRTPRRRMQSRNSLHRAVLIRSAQRTARKIELEAEEEEEVEEVEETIQPVEMDDVEEVDEDEEGGDEDHAQPPASGWRKSLEAVSGALAWPFRSSSVPRDVEEGEEDTGEEAHEGDEHYDEFMEEENEQPLQEDNEEAYDDEDEGTHEYHDDNDDMEPQPGPSQPQDTSHAPPLGNFMSPQVPRISRDHARYSVGGFTTGGVGPRRVKLVDPWKINDLVVPLKEEPKEEAVANPFTSPTKRERITEEERKAILERRRSALNTPDTFTPGLGPLATRRSVSPTKALAPLPALNLTQTIHEVKDEEDTEEDTAVMLARMKQMVDSVKKRQSTGPRPSLGVGLTPRKPGQFSLFAAGADLTSPRKSSNSSITPSQSIEDVDMEDRTDESDNPFFQKDTSMDEQAPQASSSRTTLDSTTIGTPKFTGMREMFKEAVQEMQTPRLDGMRELFRPERVQVTPAYEGVGQMLATPADDHGPEPEDQAMSDDEEAPAPTRASMRARKPTSSSKSKVPPARRTTPRTATVSAEDVTPNIALPAVSEDDVGPAETSQPKRPGPASRVTRKPRGQSAEADPVPGSSRPARTRVAPKTEDTVEEKPTTSKPAPARRGRKAAESPAPDAEEAPSAPSTTKSTTRKPRAVKTPTAELENKPATTTKASGSRRGTQAKPTPDDDEDELDGIPRDNEKKDAGAKVRRSARGKVKEEDTEDSSPALTTVSEESEEASVPAPAAGPSRAIRARKTPATKTTTTAAAPASRSMTRGRAVGGASAKKAAAEEAGVGEMVDKENTPEPSTEEEPSDGPVGGGSKKTTATSVTMGSAAKVTRSRATPTPTVEAEGKGTASKTRVSRTKTAAKK